MEELEKPTTMVEITNAIHKTYTNWAPKANMEGDGVKIYNYDGWKIPDEFLNTWCCL